MFSPHSPVRKLALFALGFVSFSAVGAVAAAVVGEIPTMSILSFVAILVLLVGFTTQLIKTPVTFAVAVAWPCAMLLALTDFGDLAPSLRSVAVAKTAAEAADAKGRVLELPDRAVRVDLRSSRSTRTRYRDSVTKREMTLVTSFQVAPLVAPTWQPGEAVELWATCSDLSDDYESCPEVWSGTDLRFLPADPHLHGEFLTTVGEAEDRHGLVSAEKPFLVQAMTADDLERLRTLPRLAVAVLTVGFVAGAVWTLRSSPAPGRHPS